VTAFITHKGREHYGKTAETAVRRVFGRTARLVPTGDRTRDGKFYRADVVKGKTGHVLGSVIVKE